ncbi:MAG: filamentous hemagglutinin N-terminal domain-containing protein, partial [Rivularia sp. (in: cyanobacteria)]
MKKIAFLSGLISGLLTSGIVLPAYSQVTSDGSTNTTVNSNGNNYQIINGIAKDSNLFHSFGKFSIPNGGSATFDLSNTNNIKTIFSRITGGDVSNINGLIQTLNSSNAVNLFLINPAGIIFGENASLDIGGSFYGTTAQSILFKNGFEFSAVNPENAPLLTVSVPIGLQMGTSSGAITVNGKGHNLITTDANFAPYTNRSVNSLQVKPGKTLALVGGDIALDGAVLNAKTGRVELSSVREGKISLDRSNQDLQLNISENSKLGSVELLQKSLVDVSGAGAGSIQVNGGSVSLKDGSVLFVQNQGLRSAGDINVNATESLKIDGISPDGKFRSGLINETLVGNSGNLNIVTPRLIIQNGGGIGSRTFSPAPGGNISLDVSELIEVNGFSEINPAVSSIIASISFGDGKAGDIIASTKKFSILDSATVSAATFGKGDGGTININAQTLEIKGIGFGFFVDTNISTSAYAKGDAGNININTENMNMEGGAFVTTVSHNAGNAGSLNINATESLQIVGKDADGRPTT